MVTLSETPESPFEGGDLQTNIKEEKAKVLTLLAEHGSAGYEIYDDARLALQGHEAESTGKIDSGRHAPTSLLESIQGRHNQMLDAAIAAVTNLRSAEGQFFDQLTDTTGRVMDMAAADRSGQLLFDENRAIFESQTREMESNTRPYDLRARPHPRGSGGGGGGGGFVGSTTVPIGLLSERTGADLLGTTFLGKVGRAAKTTSGRLGKAVPSGTSARRTISGGGGSATYK